MERARRLADSHYFEWLAQHVNPDEDPTILHELFDRDFYWSIPMDENRNDDGVYLRTLYTEQTNRTIDIDLTDNISTVLEFLIALADRTDGATSHVQNVGFWFHMFLHNMGLGHPDYYMTHGVVDDEYIDICVERLLSHQYSYNGTNGGLFVMDSPPKDLRRIEFWWQLQYWVLENYMPDEE